MAKPEAYNGAEHPVPAAISGKHPSRPVAAMRCRRKADNIQARSAVTKTRDRLAPIVPVAVAFNFLPGHALAVLNEPGTAPAGNDLALELGDGPHPSTSGALRLTLRTDGLLSVRAERSVSEVEAPSPRRSALQTQDILHERPHAKAGAASRGMRQGPL